MSAFPLQPEDYEQWSEVAALGLMVKLDGTPYTAISATWTENAHGATDSLSVVIPLSSNPDFPSQLFRGQPQFAQQDVSIADLSSPASEEIIGQSSSLAPDADVTIELYVGFPQSPSVAPTSITQLTCFFKGEVDSYTGDFGGDTVTFRARSVGSHLVDDTLTSISTNQTIGQFLTDQATKYSLPPPKINIATPPVTLQQVLAYDQIAGSNYQASIYGMHPMDLAIRGAQVDDADVWVDVRDGTIHYESPSLVQRNTVDLKWGRDWIGLSAMHSPQFSKNIEVVVYTHQPKTRYTHSVSISDDGSGNITVVPHSSIVTTDTLLGTNQSVSSSSRYNENTGTTTYGSSVSSSVGGNVTESAKTGANESAKQRYPLYVGNVSANVAKQMGLALRRQISQQEYSIEGEVPITNRLLQQLSITSLLRIHGNPWQLTNDSYYPRSIEYSASVTEGFHAKITAVNHVLPAGGA